jgi:serine phosphatase RsbU (regulator of sigma subunit)/Tfp pilus assembly protein PilF
MISSYSDIIKRNILLLLFIFIINFIYANYADSLKTLLEELPENELPAIYNKLSNLYMDSVGNQAIDFALKSIEISEKHGLDERLCYAYIMLGSAYLAKSDYKNALEIFKQSITYAENTNNRFHLHTINNNIGVIYRNVEEHELALTYFHSALNHAKAIDDKESIMQTLTNIGNVYAINKNYNEGLKYFLLAAEIGESAESLTMNLPGVYNNIGWIFQMTEKYDDAMKYYKSAHDIFDSLNVIWGKVILLNNMAGVHILENRMYEAEALIILADSLHDSSDLRQSKMNLYQTAYQLYESTQQFQKAFFYQSKYHEVKDSVHSEELDQLIHELKTQYEVEALKKDSELKQLNISKKNNLIYTLFLIIGLIIISTLILIRLNQQKTELNNKLTKSNKEILGKNEIIQQNLKYAAGIQAACMKTSIKPLNYKEKFVIDFPLNIVGGDFYMFRQKDNEDYIIAADCTGHGISGGFLSVLSIQYIDLALTHFSKPYEILNYLNHKFYDYFAVNQGLAGESLCISIIRINKEQMIFSSSKHKIWTYNNILGLTEYSGNNQTIGINKNSDYEDICIDLSSISQVYTGSDGYADQFGGNQGKKMKYPQFRLILEASTKLEFNKQKQFLCSEFNKWKGDKDQTDDVLLIGIML